MGETIYDEAHKTNANLQLCIALSKDELLFEENYIKGVEAKQFLKEIYEFM